MALGDNSSFVYLSIMEIVTYGDNLFTSVIY